MQAAYGGNPTRIYLAQRINSASAEELASMLLEGAQRFLLEAVKAIHANDLRAKAQHLQRVSQIMQKLLGMLNPEADRALVDKLHGIYIWWIKEMFEGSRKNRPEQIERVVRQMAAMRSGWEELSKRQSGSPKEAEFSVEGLVG
ncbi:MAG: flagellar export chaperone FliS [Holophaga sp.]|nr:flagellar export chaperone FliS [Holophaga sp.]